MSGLPRPARRAGVGCARRVHVHEYTRRASSSASRPCARMPGRRDLVRPSPRRYAPPSAPAASFALWRQRRDGPGSLLSARERPRLGPEARRRGWPQRPAVAGLRWPRAAARRFHVLLMLRPVGCLAWRSAAPGAGGEDCAAPAQARRRDRGRARPAERERCARTAMRYKPLGLQTVLAHSIRPLRNPAPEHLHVLDQLVSYRDPAVRSCTMRSCTMLRN